MSRSLIRAQSYLMCLLLMVYTMLPSRFSTLVQWRNDSAKFSFLFIILLLLTLVPTRLTVSRGLAISIAAMFLFMLYALAVSSNAQVVMIRTLVLFSPFLVYYGFYSVTSALPIAQSRSQLIALYYVAAILLGVSVLILVFPSFGTELNHEKATMSNVRLYSVFGGPIATGLVLLFMICFTLMLRGQLLLSKNGYILLLVFLVMCILFTGSRMTTASLAIGIMFILLFVKNLKLIISSGLLLLLIGATQYFLSESVVVSRTLSWEANQGDFSRLMSVQTAINAIVESIGKGVGVGDLYSPYFSFEGQGAGANLMVTNYGKTLIEPHNLMLLIAAESGMFGFLLYGSLLLLVFVHMFRVSHSYIRGVVLGMFFMVVFHQLGGSHLALNPNVSIFAFAFLGIYFGHLKNKQQA